MYTLNTILILSIIWSRNILLLVEKLPMQKGVAFLSISTSAAQVHQVSLCLTKEEYKVTRKQFNQLCVTLETQKRPGTVQPEGAQDRFLQE